MGGHWGHSQMQGLIQLQPHLRPLILGMHPPWGSTLHIKTFVLCLVYYAYYSKHEQDPRRGIHKYKGPSNCTWKFLWVVYACYHASFVKEFQKVFTKDKGRGALEVHAPVHHIQNFKVAGIGPKWTTTHQCTSWLFSSLDGLHFFIRRHMGFITLHFFWLLTTVLSFFFLGSWPFFPWTWPHT
jgi:hypothetical protein